VWRDHGHEIVKPRLVFGKHEKSTGDTEMNLCCPHCHGVLTAVTEYLEAEEKRKREEALQEMLADIRSRPDGTIKDFERWNYMPGKDNARHE